MNVGEDGRGCENPSMVVRGVQNLVSQRDQAARCPHDRLLAREICTMQDHMHQISW